MFLAWRNLGRDGTRLALSVGGIGLAIMLIVFMDGFRSGVYQQATAYLDHTTGSVVVAQAGVDTFVTGSSLLPAGTVAAASHIPGVARVVPILSQIAILDLHGTKEAAYLIGYTPGLGGGPWRLAAGRQPAADNEVVVDRVLAEQHAMTVGSTLPVLGRRFGVVGLSDGTRMWTGSYIFMSTTALASLLRTPGATGLLLVTPSPGIAPEALRQRLGRLPGTTVLLKRTLTDNDASLLAKVYDPPIRLMAGIAFLVGVLVVGLVIYTATMERQREYGALKAIGAPGGLLYRMVAVQALIAALAGAGAGIGLAFGSARLVMWLRPQFLVPIEPTAVAQALSAALAMALVAALVSAYAVARLAPADAFRR